MSDFVVSFGGEAVAAGQQVLEIGKTLLTGERDFETHIGVPSSLDSDLLRIASAIFAADRAVARGDGEDLCRTFHLEIPVVNIGRLQPLRLQIEDVLYRLSQDAWTIDFVQMSGAVEPKRRKDKPVGKTLLFSGGADSLAAALEFAGEPLQLISHKTYNMATDASQKGLAAFLSENGYSLPHAQIFVSSRDGGPTDLKHAEEEAREPAPLFF